MSSDNAMTAAAAPGRRAAQRAATRAEIVTAARALLNSPDDLSLRSVAHQMGFTAPALYRYVDSYEDLLALVAGDIYSDILQTLTDAAGRVPADDLAGQIVLASVAFRRWALANRAEFGLLFANTTGKAIGMPEPGQAADGPAARFGDFFARIYQALWEQHRFPLPDVDLGLPPADMAGAHGYGPASHLADAPPGLTWVFIRAWARLYGTITLEVFGHLDEPLVRSAVLFRATLADCAADLHLSDELPRLAVLIEEAMAG